VADPVIRPRRDASLGTAAEAGLPIIRRLRADWTPEMLFRRLSELPGCLWLDSASASDSPVPCDRYSFVTAAPIAWLRHRVTPPEPIPGVAFRIADDSPWPRLQDWVARLPATNVSEYQGDPMPPFQGGMAGLIGYEAGAWLEPTGVSLIDDLATDTIALGCYDVVFAWDHRLDRGWVFSQGFAEESFSRSVRHAEARLDQFTAWIDDPLAKAPESCLSRSPAQPFVVPDTAASAGGVSSDFTPRQFENSVQEIIDRICRGDSFQVNLAQRLTTPATCPSRQLYSRLRAHSPAPFGSYFDAGPFQVLSSSPEGFLQVRDRKVETRPIKGTAPRTGDEDIDRRHAKRLRESPKERAENVMIVDLMRNDLSRVCDDDSVTVDRLCQLEPYAFVQHLVSVITGTLRRDATIVDLVMACFPGGSVTGAPKIEAMRTIAELEPHRRGPYCGSLGYISSQRDADFNILIRTITAAGGVWQCPVGGGITARSDPAAELAETWTKAEGMLNAIGSTNQSVKNLPRSGDLLDFRQSQTPP